MLKLKLQFWRGVEGGGDREKMESLVSVLALSDEKGKQIVMVLALIIHQIEHFQNIEVDNFTQIPEISLIFYTNWCVSVSRV